MVAEKVQELEDENAMLKAQLEKLLQMYGEGMEGPRDCSHCSNFHQHYIRSDGGSYYPAYCGHCAAGGRMKGRKPGDTCRAFGRMRFGENFI